MCPCWRLSRLRSIQSDSIRVTQVFRLIYIGKLVLRDFLSVVEIRDDLAGWIRYVISQIGTIKLIYVWQKIIFLELLPAAVIEGKGYHQSGIVCGIHRQFSRHLHLCLTEWKAVPGNMEMTDLFIVCIYIQDNQFRQVPALSFEGLWGFFQQVITAFYIIAIYGQVKAGNPTVMEQIQRRYLVHHMGRGNKQHIEVLLALKKLRIFLYALLVDK